jgi:hypothetical protein
MSCKSCFQDWLCKCLPYDSEITINANLPVGNYVVVVTDKFDAKYEAAVQVYDQGSFTLNINDFPEGIFSSPGETIKIEIMEADGCTPIKIPMLAEYDCLEVEIKNGTMEKSNVGCFFLT